MSAAAPDLEHPAPNERDWDRLPATEKQVNAIITICSIRRLNVPLLEKMSKRQASDWLGQNSEGRLYK